MKHHINLWAITSIVLILAIAIYFVSSNQTQKQPSALEGNKKSAIIHAPPVPVPGKTFMLHSSNWEFMPSTIKVKQGENASLHLMGIEGNHGIAIPGLGINETMGRGENKSVKIPTDKPGTYEFFCNVSCGQGHNDMRGTIIIE